MKSALALSLTLLAALAAMPASAQSFSKPENAVEYRQAAMTLMGAHLGQIGAMVNGKVPYDPKVAIADAQVLALVSHLPWAGFAPGTESLSKKAKPDIWLEPAKFKSNAEKIEGETAKLLAAAQTQNLDKLKAAFTSTAQTCKSCHDTFRAK